MTKIGALCANMTEIFQKTVIHDSIRDCEKEYNHLKPAGSENFANEVFDAQIQCKLGNLGLSIDTPSFNE